MVEPTSRRIDDQIVVTLNTVRLRAPNPGFPNLLPRVDLGFDQRKNAVSRKTDLDVLFNQSRKCFPGRRTDE